MSQRSIAETHGVPWKLSGRVRLRLARSLFGSIVVAEVEELFRVGAPRRPGAEDDRPVRCVWRMARPDDIFEVGGGPFVATASE